MLLVGECIVSEDVKTTSFCCDLSKCKGCCCVEGDAGAPLLKEELPVIEKLLPQIKPYRGDKGRFLGKGYRWRFVHQDNRGQRLCLCGV